MVEMRAVPVVMDRPSRPERTCEARRHFRAGDFEVFGHLVLVDQRAALELDVIRAT